MACGASELVIPLTEIYALLQSLETWVKNPSTSDDITIYGTAKAGVGIDVDYSTALITGIMSLTTYGNTVTNLIANGAVTTSLLSDDSGTNIGLEPNGTWAFDNAYDPTEQLFQGAIGDRILVMTRLKADSVGRIKKQYFQFSGSANSGATVADSLYLVDIITLSFDTPFNIKLQESTAGTIEREYQILINLTQYGTAETDTDILASIFPYSDATVSVGDQRLLSSSLNLFDKKELTQGARINEGTGGIYAGDIPTNGDSYSGYIKIKPDNAYKQSGNIAGGNRPYAWYDSNFNFISGGASANPSATSPDNAHYIRLSILWSEKDTSMLELGSSASTYEPHEETSRLVEGGLSRVSDSIIDKVDNEGNVIRETGNHDLLSADITAFTAGANNEYATIPRTKFSGANIWTTGIDGQLQVHGLEEVAFSGLDVVANQGKYCTDATNFYLLFDPALYADLATCRVGEAGKNYVYELETYTGALEKQPSSPLIVYKDGQVTKIPWYADSGITVGDKLTLTKPISKIYKAWEWIGSEMVPIDIADLTLDTSTQVDIAGAISGYIIYLEGYLLTENVAVSKGIYTAPYNGAAQIEGNMKNIVLLSKKQTEIERKVDMVVTGDAEIHLSDGSTAQSIPTGATYEKLINFDSNGIASIGVPDYVNNKITLPKGIYRVFVSVSFTIGTNNTKFFVAAFMGGVEQHQVHFTRELATGADTASTSACGLIHVTADDTEIDIRARHDDGGAVNITLNYANLNVEKRG